MELGDTPLDVYGSAADQGPRRVEKANSPSALPRRLAAPTQARMVISSSTNLSELSRSETVALSLRPDSAPLCSFLAQLIGQVLETKPRNAEHAARVYAGNAAATAVRQPSALVDSA